MDRRHRRRHTGNVCINFHSSNIESQYCLVTLIVHSTNKGLRRLYKPVPMSLE
ncbi:Uncharacterised protein [Mycobacteroides abscessus subsp. abscessus]|nr:Uncharacterised protein [Mycobacteroides abscessus subsp. abscessus]